MPRTCQTPQTIEVFAMGNGITGNHADVSKQLKYAILKTLPLSVCRQVYPFMSGRTGHICAYSEQKQSVCKGDSGGPLVDTSDGTLTGISSFVGKGK